MSMTDCPDCWKVETPWHRRMAAKAINGGIDFLMRPNSAQVAIASFGTSMRIILGGTPEPTWYEKHRARWIETGDVTELARMTRHVTAL